MLTALLPAAFVAVRVTVKVPEAAKAWVGFCCVLVLPSPKLQAQAVGVLVDASVKVTVWPMAGTVGVEVKAATGASTAWDTVTLLLTVLEPPALVAVNETLKIPEAAKAWVGLFDVLVEPSPKVQDQAVGVLVDASVKVTV